jgi:hypothetical protein
MVSAGQSGDAANADREFARHSASAVSAAAHSDTSLGSHLAVAAMLASAGAKGMDVVAADNRTTAMAAAYNTTPADEKAILTALRSQLARTQQIIGAAGQGASQIADGARTLDYPSGASDDRIIGDSDDGIEAVDYSRTPLPMDPAPQPPLPTPQPGPLPGTVILPPAPPGKEWHNYGNDVFGNGGWVLEDPLQPCSAGKEGGLLAGIAAGVLAATTGGVFGRIEGILGAGAAGHELEQCAPP